MCTVKWGSVVDLTFATPTAAPMVKDWRVVEGVETLSDHRYIRFEVSASPESPAESSRGRSRFPRWAISKLDRELAEEAAIVGRWSLPSFEDQRVDEAAGLLCNTLTAVCRAAMPRVGRPPPRRALYWWSTEIADLRAACFAAQRAYKRGRRRRPGDLEGNGQLLEVWREKKKNYSWPSVGPRRKHGRSSWRVSIEIHGADHTGQREIKCAPSRLHLRRPSSQPSWGPL